MNSIKKINKICKNIKALTSDDFEAVNRMAIEQKSYLHPLKYAKQSRLNSLGDYNFKVMIALQNLKNVIDNGKSIIHGENKTKI